MNPLCFRLGVTQQHHSHWFAKKVNYAQLVMEDHFIRKLITDQFPKAGILSISIFRRGEKLDVKLVATQPRVLLHHGGPDLERLRQEWNEKISQRRQTIGMNVQWSTSIVSQVVDLSLRVIKVKDLDTWAPAIAAGLVDLLEKRQPFRRAMKSVLKKATRQRVQGIKIQVSGRLNGAEIARTEWLRRGRVPLQTLRARVDYSHTTAHTKYGLLGIKVWVFEGLAPPAQKRDSLGAEAEKRKALA